MIFVPFHDYFPELAERETRCITVIENSGLGLPAGDYSFHEMFCNEPGCDCRRVFFSVSSAARERIEATIAYGWESREFYAAWMKDDEPCVLDALKGPVLNLGSPESELAPALLRAARIFLLSDEEYVERVKRHYELFREKIDGRGVGAAVRSLKTRRNAPCPCGSGRKYKKCCLHILD